MVSEIIASVCDAFHRCTFGLRWLLKKKYFPSVLHFTSNLMISGGISSIGKSRITPLPSSTVYFSIRLNCSLGLLKCFHRNTFLFRFFTTRSVFMNIASGSDWSIPRMCS